MTSVANSVALAHSELIAFRTGFPSMNTISMTS